MWRETEGGMTKTGQSGPKRRVWHCLGHRYVFLFILGYFFTLTNVLLYIYVLTYETRCYTRCGEKRKAGRRKLAQTMLNMSFGPLKKKI